MPSYLEIGTLIIALWGAILSTLQASWTLIKGYFEERRRIRIFFETGLIDKASTITNEIIGREGVLMIKAVNSGH